ncbi:MAG: SDR family NAD(P)-dependent oxidoreductase [Bdellovibrionota bacterium]
MAKKIALVTGSARGLGWGAAKALAQKGFHVVLLGRDAGKLEARKTEIEKSGSSANVVRLDLSDAASIDHAAAEVKRAYPAGIQVLINNAGIFPEKAGAYSRSMTEEVMQVNALGPLQFSLALAAPLAAGNANVVNVSSGMASLADMGAGYPAYRLSKCALNAATRYLSQEWKGLRVNSVCPGWVKTEMGGDSAERSIEEGVASILWAALLGENGPSGGFFRDGKPLPW